jgi:hypothetical protein
MKNRFSISGLFEDSLLNQESNTLPLLQQQLVETNRGIQNLLNAIQQGVFHTSSTKQRLDELEAAKSDLEVRILQEKMVKPTLTKEQLIFWLSRFRKLDVTQKDQRQRLIDTFVNAIYLYDDKIVLHVIAFTSAVAVDTAVRTTTVDIHSVLRGEDSFVLFIMHA